MFLGKIYFTWRRYLQWMFNRSIVYAATYQTKQLPYIVAVHKTPLYRRLRKVDMWLQENKVNNLKLATEKISGLVLRPGETFSFWRLVGKPTKAKGFLKGMVLTNGSFTSGVGGGLCQLSNLIYGYFNLSLLQREYFDAWGLTPGEVNKSLGGYQPEIDLGSRNRRYTPKKVIFLIRALLAARKAISKADRTFQEVRTFTQEWLKTDLKASSNEQLISSFEEIWQHNHNYCLIEGLLNFSAGSSLSMLYETLNKHFPGRGTALANALMLGQGKIVSAEQGYAVYRFINTFEK